MKIKILEDKVEIHGAEALETQTFGGVPEVYVAKGDVESIVIGANGYTQFIRRKRTSAGGCCAGRSYREIGRPGMWIRGAYSRPADGGYELSCGEGRDQNQSPVSKLGCFQLYVGQEIKVPRPSDLTAQFLSQGLTTATRVKTETRQYLENLGLWSRDSRI